MPKQPRRDKIVMKEIKYKILYLGMDEIFYSSLQSYFNSKSLQQADIKKNYIYEEIEFPQKKAGSIFCQEIEKEPAHLIFIDFANYDKESKEHLQSYQEVLSFLVLSRHHQSMAQTPLIGVFHNKEQINEFKQLIHFGLFYTYIKGDDIDQVVFHDASYIAFENHQNFPSYASASALQLPLQMELPAFILSFAEDQCIIETDITPSLGEKLELRPSFFQEFSYSPAEVDYVNENAIASGHTTLIKLHNNYPGPWDDTTEKTLFRDTVETWILNNQECYSDSALKILIINKELNELSSLHKINKNNAKFEIDYFPCLKDPANLIENMPYDLIFYEQEDENENENNTNHIFELIQAIKQRNDIIPMIVVFNCNSGFHAFQKAFAYTSILTHNEKMNTETIGQLVDLFLKRKATPVPVSESAIQNFFNRTHNMTSAAIILNTFITSVTEHEITFLTTEELPYFSVLRISQPFDMFITIIPPIKELSHVKDSFHYMGFIHGVTEKELKILRRFVYQSAYQKPEMFALNTINNEELCHNDDKELEKVSLRNSEQKGQPFIEIDRKLIAAGIKRKL